MSVHRRDGGSATLNLGRTSSIQTGMEEVADAAHKMEASTAPRGMCNFRGPAWPLPQNYWRREEWVGPGKTRMRRVTRKWRLQSQIRKCRRNP